MGEKSCTGLLPHFSVYTNSLIRAGWGGKNYFYNKRESANTGMGYSPQLWPRLIFNQIMKHCAKDDPIPGSNLTEESPLVAKVRNYSSYFID